MKVLPDIVCRARAVSDRCARDCDARPLACVGRATRVTACSSARSSRRPVKSRLRTDRCYWLLRNATSGCGLERKVRVAHQHTARLLKMTREPQGRCMRQSSKHARNGLCGCGAQDDPRPGFALEEGGDRGLRSFAEASAAATASPAARAVLGRVDRPLLRASAGGSRSVCAGHFCLIFLRHQVRRRNPCA